MLYSQVPVVCLFLVSIWAPKLCLPLGGKTVTLPWAAKLCYYLWAAKLCLALGGKTVWLPGAAKLCYYLWAAKLCLALGGKTVTLKGRQNCDLERAAKLCFE